MELTEVQRVKCCLLGIKLVYNPGSKIYYTQRVKDNKWLRLESILYGYVNDKYRAPSIDLAIQVASVKINDDAWWA